MMKGFYITVFFLFTLWGCTGNQKKQQAGRETQAPDSIAFIDTAKQPERDTQPTVPPANPKTILKDVVLYVPESLPEGVPVPVIYLFDPHADGELPVDQYRQLAEDFGMVLAGSKLSQNGQSMEKGMQIFEDMEAEVQKRLNVDQRRIYTMGFSGGARVAVYLALTHPEIDGVVGCGAGFPQADRLQQPAFNYIGMVGNADFNLNELIQTNKKFNDLGANSVLITFDGDHNWPPSGVMHEAFLIMQLNGMRDGRQQKSADIIQEAHDFYAEGIAQLQSESRLYAADQMAERAIKVLDGLGSNEEFVQLSADLQQQTEYKNQKAERNKYLQQETEQQYVYMSSFATRDLDWWKNQLAGLRKATGNREENLMNKRLLSFLGLVAYMMSDRDLKQNNLKAAQKDIEIYRLVEPENPEHEYMSAMLNMKQNNPDAAVKDLEKAVDLGFTDTDRAWDEPAFKPLRSRSDFSRLFR